MKKRFSYDESENELSVLPEIVLGGNSEVTLDHVNEINEYSPERVKVSLGKLFVTITGDGLSIIDLGAERLMLSGSILSLSFSS